MRYPDQAAGGGAERMDEIASLPVIPPAQVFHVDPERLETGFSLLNLDLRTAVRQQKRHITMEQDSHLLTSPEASPVASHGQTCEVERPFTRVLLGKRSAPCKTEPRSAGSGTTYGH